MRYKAHAILISCFILGLTLASPGASSATSEWMWCHGHSAVVEFPDRTDWMVYRGWGLDFNQKLGLENWVHLAVPTSARLDALQVRVRYVRIRFWATASTLHNKPGITDVHIFNGETRVREFSDLNWIGTGAWQTKELDLGSLIMFDRGLGITVKVKADYIITKDETEFLQDSFRFIFAGAGARFEW